MRLLFSLLTGFVACCSYGQKPSDTTVIKIVVDSINREVDRAVVGKNISYLQKHFATDFKFTHGTGMLDNKESWIGKAQSPRVQYVSREHDSINVELHNDIAIVTGVLRVILPPGGNRYGYAIRYERIYRLNTNVWEMISHRTFAEWDIKQ
jgi:hypothetical protein